MALSRPILWRGHAPQRVRLRLPLLRECLAGPPPSTHDAAHHASACSPFVQVPPSARIERFVQIGKISSQVRITGPSHI